MSLLIKINEEYGFRHWTAEVTQEQFEEICRKWQTIKGLNCLVPVTLIFPTAKKHCPQDDRVVDYSAHVHEFDDSNFSGAPDYVIPKAENFEMDGKVYQQDEYWPHKQPVKE